MPQAGRPRYLDETTRAVRRDAAVYLLIVVHAFAGLLFLEYTGIAETVSYGLYFDRWAIRTVLFMPVVLVLGTYLLQLRRGQRRRTALAYAVSARRLATLTTAVVMLFAFMLFQGAFTSVKNGLSLAWGGFPHDRLQADIDAALHFGIDPWRLMFAVVRDKTFLAIVEWNYGVMWFFVSFGALVAAILSPGGNALRRRYLVTFILVWAVAGNLFAGLFMSAGPAFYGAVTGDAGRFAEQLSWLALHDGGSAFYQDYLWRLHIEGVTGFGSGISAFPSVHVALAAMNAMFAWSIDRRLGIAAWLYVAFIQFSSVYLAWHYAIDGYAGIAITAVVYQAVARLPSLLARPVPAVPSIPDIGR